MREDCKSQSIIITGESGSGKTEAAKHCIRLLAEVAGSELAAEEKLLLATPVLEAFGNAKTLRNENSSRVGKWTEILFSDRGTVAGALIRNFLLEKTRVVRQAKGERNFRVFYQLLAHRDEFPALNLGAASRWRYLSDAPLRSDNEFQCFEEMKTAMCGLKLGEVEGVMKVLAAILHLGNLTFGERDSECEVNEDIHFSSACSLLGVPASLLRQSLCHKTLHLAKETILKPHTPSQAAETAANLSKTLYTSLFHYLLATINQQMLCAEDSQVRLGVLDIYGFEIFPENSFEQLCINYANEKLQQYFVQCLFKEEEDVYETEGIPFSAVNYSDNLPILNLIESGGNSLLSLINDEIMLQRASDESLLKRIYSSFQSNPSFCSDFHSNTQFLVQHYSGEVIYDVSGFIAKSKDQVSEDLIELIESSSAALVREVCSGQLRQSKKSIGIQFKEELDELLESLADYTPHFVRCIKPNSTCSALTFEGSLVLHQVRCLGLVEATSIFQTGFPFKVPHKEFVHRYKCFAPTARAPNPKAMCKRLVDVCGEEGFRIGKTMVLFGFRQRKKLEKLRNEGIEKVVVLLQKSKEYVDFRAFSARKLRAELKAAAPELTSALQSSDIDYIRSILLKYSHLRFETHALRRLKDLATALTEECRIDEDFTRLLAEQRPETVLEEMVNVVEKAVKLRYRSPLIADCEARITLAKAVKSARLSLQRLTETHPSAWELRTTLSAVAEQGLEAHLSEQYTAAQALLEKLEREAGLKQFILSLLQSGALSQYPPNDEYRLALAQLQSTLGKAAAGEPFASVETEAVYRVGKVLYEFRSAVLDGDWQRTEALMKDVTAHKELRELQDLAIVRERLAARESESTLQSRLVAAVQSQDVESIRILLSKVSSSSSSITASLVAAAESVLRDYDAIEAKAASAGADLPRIDEVLAECQSKGVSSSAVTALAQKKRDIESFACEASLALNLLSLNRLRTALNRAKELGIEKHPLIDEITYILYDTKESTLARWQYEAAVKLGDKALILDRLLSMRDLQWRSNSASYVWTRYPRLRSPEDWAASKWLGRDVLAKGMLKHSKHLLPTSLTIVRSGKHEKLALDLFKSVLTVMGDRVAHNDIVGEVLDILVTGVRVRELREEIYMQLLKQLTKNDDESSIRKGWDLLTICLRCFFHPSLDCYLHSFIRTEAPDPEKLLRLMYYTQVQPLAEEPSREWIARYLKMPWDVSFTEVAYSVSSHPTLTHYSLRLKDSKTGDSS